MMHNGRNMSPQMLMIAGASPPSSSSHLQSPPFFPVEDISYPPNSRGYPVPYGVPAMSPYEYTDMGDASSIQPSELSESSLPLDGYYLDQSEYWHANPAGLHDDMRKLELGPGMVYRKTSESPSDFLHSGGMHIPYRSGSYPDINERYAEHLELDEDIPPYAELIFEALKSAPGHQMHLQDIYQWFRDRYARFRHDTGKGWMNSIRHNLSMNGAFVKVERPANDPGKGFLWLLAPAALEGGIHSTTRYRKNGSAKTRSSDVVTADVSYSSYVTPKRNRTGKKIQTKARRTAKKNLQRIQGVDQQQQQPHEYGDMSSVHTPIDMPSMTPDFSPSYQSENLSDTLSIGSRHATPALSMRNAEWQSPIAMHRQASPYYSQSDDGFGSSYDNSMGHGFANYGYDCKPHPDYDNNV
ncbi:hypothetical protein DRE_01446 [Drechslerella stenobrocha 248]|uniref:Fork-head domain-containing protein n=1 Tax=Drechslerella stenobrocha 248 TaxID=1043628 RepID=W7HKL8_9PEZI|nr:hypothetical protein DRE_01446 [Drechslerella stenobrocha 248]